MNLYAPIPEHFVLGTCEKSRVAIVEQLRQRAETEQILHRLGQQPGVILADEVGMGKTFVALAVSYCVAKQSRRGPVVVMVPPNLIEKWEQDLHTFCSLYLDGVTPFSENPPAKPRGKSHATFRYGKAQHSVEFLRLLDDPKDRCQLVFLAQGAMSRAQTDKWVRLALIRETLRRHGRRAQLAKVKPQIHRFLAELLGAKEEQRASVIGEELWDVLLKLDPLGWKVAFNLSLKSEKLALKDDPVPESVIKALNQVDLDEFAIALSEMPVRARGSEERISERISQAGSKLREAERSLWKLIIAKMRWRSPLLVLDEAHHLKNPGTSLAKQLQSHDSNEDLKLGDGAMAGCFDRMLFLTATPFQLGHHELVQILQRFDGVRWDTATFGEKATFNLALQSLLDSLTASQRTSIRLQKAWTRIADDDMDGKAVENWWQELLAAPVETLEVRHKALVESFQQAKLRKEESESLLRPWVIRHNKGEFWQHLSVLRRQCCDGAAITGDLSNGGITIPSNQLLPFFLAARSAVNPGKDLLGEALCSSYEAFRRTRKDNLAGRDDLEIPNAPLDMSHSTWFLEEFDNAIARHSGAVHPKIHATVQRVVDLWESGEKVLVFAFYRHTCRSLRIHISQEIEKRLMTHARRRLAGAGLENDDESIERIIDSIHNRFFRPGAPGRQELDQALLKIVSSFQAKLSAANVDVETVIDVMRRFLRVNTTLVRAFPIHETHRLESDAAVKIMLDAEDASGVSWRSKFETFIEFLTNQCSGKELTNYLEAAERTQTGKIHVHAGDPDIDAENDEDSVGTLANVQVATGDTKRSKRARLMMAFNSPFFPDILVCSQVMGEGVDLHRYCRFIIHHDLDWNPSTIEQRTGRVDRLGCKAEQKQLPILVYRPYLTGASDERKFRVMTDRESWFRIVMGQEEVARLISEDTEPAKTRPPASLQQELVFNLGSCVVGTNIGGLSMRESEQLESPN